MRTSKYRYLSQINSPADLRKLQVSELPKLCEELRDYIITETAENPGHLGSSLGAVELAVAIHYVFDTPHDKLVWDVGHQAYAHKILTGSKEFGFNMIRKHIKVEPATWYRACDEMGILVWQDMPCFADNRKNHWANGSGEFDKGADWPASAETKANVLIILNDNKIAIDKNVGAMSRNLLNITSSPGYNRAKNRLWNFLSVSKPIRNRILRFFSKMGNAIKGAILLGSNLFQALGFRYFGPVDGHNVEHLVKVLQGLKPIKGARLLHAITVKGKGLTAAEQNQTTYHAPGKFDPDTGERISTSEAGQPPKYQDVFGETILELAKQDERVVGITPAMATGCSLTILGKVFPDRAIDVGIAEQHAVTFAAGLAAQGMVPFCNIYSSFLQRAYDQIIHDVALQKLPVIFCVDRAGLVGEDGATHHGVFDMAFLRSVPNMIIAAAMDENDLRNLMYTAYRHRELPFAIRYPRGRGVGTDWHQPMQELEIGKGRVLQQGKDIAVISIGKMGQHVQQALAPMRAAGLHPTHVDMRFLAPLDLQLLEEVAATHKVLFTVEDGVSHGGLFSAVAEVIAQRPTPIPVIPIAINDRFVEHGDINSLYDECGLTPEKIAEKIIQYNIL